MPLLARRHELPGLCIEPVYNTNGVGAVTDSLPESRSLFRDSQMLRTQQRSSSRAAVAVNGGVLSYAQVFFVPTIVGWLKLATKAEEIELTVAAVWVGTSVVIDFHNTWNVFTVSTST